MVAGFQRVQMHLASQSLGLCMIPRRAWIGPKVSVPDLQQPPGNAQAPLQLSLPLGAGVQGALHLCHYPEDKHHVSLGTPRPPAPVPRVARDPPARAVRG